MSQPLLPSPDSVDRHRLLREIARITVAPEARAAFRDQPDLLEFFDCAGQWLVTTEQVAALIAASPDTVAAWRNSGDGPLFVRLAGRRLARYQLAELIPWIARHPRWRSTAEESSRG